jgi:U3 small nucleolar ribonucleoprotein protein IMP4
MLLSSSRSPSQQTRSACKWLASFFGCTYLNRGKRSLGELLDVAGEEPLLVIGEYHGNPASLLVYDEVERVSVRFTVSSGDEELPRHFPAPRICGNGRFAESLASVLSLPIAAEDAPDCLKVTDRIMEFRYSGNVMFRFNIRSIRIYGDDE